MRFSLEESVEDRKHLAESVFAFGEQFINSLSDAKAYNITEVNSISKACGFKVDKETYTIDEILSLLEKELIIPGLNTASGSNMGYIPGGGLFSSSLGDYIAAISNKYAGVHFASPGAVAMENELISWTASLVGYSKGYGGNLTSGGSIANLIALLTAKKAKKINTRNIPKAVIYCSNQSHHSILRAINIIGLEECIIRYIPIDSDLRLNPNDLEEQVIKDLKIGLNPFLIVANAGSTDAGMIDPLKAIGKIALQYSLWFHVDAAYGGFYLLTERGRERLGGISLADSIILDPHKSMFLPYGSGMVLVKDVNHLLDANKYSANYMQDTSEYKSNYSPSQLSPELSKHFRGLRMWLPLKLYGQSVFTDYLDEKLDLATYFYNSVKEMGLEVGSAPDLSIVTFRYVPVNRNANDFNLSVLKGIHHNGKIFISSTTIDGKFILRAAIVSFRTHKAEVDSLIDILKANLKQTE